MRTGLLPTIRRACLDAATVQHLHATALASRHVGPSTLTGPFATSRGFALTFTWAGVATVRRNLPFLEPFLRLALPTPRRWHVWVRPPPNAFFLNLLLVPPTVGVGPHIDATLAAPAGVDAARPARVTVLYLHTPPPGSGGELRLSTKGRPIATIAPEPGMLVHFDGSLCHEVLPSHDGTTVRASLVCEQYRFGAQALARLPAFAIKGHGFASVLAAQAGRPLPAFVVD